MEDKRENLTPSKLRYPSFYHRLEYCVLSAQWSPFDCNRVAAACAAHFGLAGKGEISICSTEDVKEKREITLSDSPHTLLSSGRKLWRGFTSVGVFCCRWSEVCAQHLLTGDADGHLCFWRLDDSIDGMNENGDSSIIKPIQTLQGHTQELQEIDWNIYECHRVSSASWDGLVKIWDMNQSISLHSLSAPPTQLCVEDPVPPPKKKGPKTVYTALWSPLHSRVLASAGADGSLRIWDIGRPTQPVVSTPTTGGFEILSLDWNKYKEFEVGTGSTDNFIRVWDIRNPSLPCVVLTGHNLAVRKVRYSPHDSDLLASASYDTSVCLWRPKQNPYQPVRRFEHHTEFVCGLDWNLFFPHVLLSAGWDRTVAVWHVDGPPPYLHPPSSMVPIL